jgi:nucleotide-binding universal stress UspA family protein
VSIVVGYIPTPEGEAALQRSIREARSGGALLVVVNTSRGDALVDQRFIQQQQADDLSRRLEDAGVEHLLLQPLRGHDPAEEVLEAAREHRAELVVIGLRRRTAVGKLILGSTAQRILLQAEVPVLAVKA